jgi:RNA polymerase sigma factor (TIGR02999 family)
MATTGFGQSITDNAESVLPQARTGQITRLLRSWSNGEPGAEEKLFPLVYDEMHQLARRCFQKERNEHTLQPTALVHEVYLRLVEGRRVEWQDRNHFFAMAAKIMRRILVDHARRRLSEKRGGGVKPLSLHESDGVAHEWANDVIAVDDALTSLSGLDPTKARLVELRFFGGLSIAEAAGALGCSPRTAQRHWQLARAWLHRELSRDDRG